MPSYDVESSMDAESHSYNAKALEWQRSSFDDRLGSNDLKPTTLLSVLATNQNNSVDLGFHYSIDSLYFDGEEEKKEHMKKGEPKFNQGGALEMLMAPPAKKKPSITSKGGTRMLPKTLPKTMSIKAKNEANVIMSSKATKKLDKLRSSRTLEGEKDKANVDAMWGRLGKGSGHGPPKHRRAKSSPIPDLTDEIGFIVEAGSPEALGSSAHRGDPTSNEFPSSSRRGGRRGQLGSSTHQKDRASQPESSTSGRSRSGNRRRSNSMRSSFHGTGDRGDLNTQPSLGTRSNSMRSSFHGAGDRRDLSTQPSPGTPRTIRRRGGTPTTPAKDSMSQSAHVSSGTPARRRMRRRASGSMGPSIDMPFDSPENGSKVSVNATDFLSPSKGVMNNSPPEGNKRHVTRVRRRSSRGGDPSSSQHGQAAKARRNSERRRQRSRDPAAVNAG